VSRLSRQCGILNISQPYRPSQTVTGIALLFYFFIFFYSETISVVYWSEFLVTDTEVLRFKNLPLLTCEPRGLVHQLLHHPTSKRIIVTRQSTLLISHIASSCWRTQGQHKENGHNKATKKGMNYTDRATTACWRSKCQLLRIQGVVWSEQQIRMAVFSAF
jgi:hypothetical protein